MDELTPDQIEALRMQRRAKFEQMGVQPTFSQQEVQQAHNQSAGAKNLSARDRINAIKNGSMREVMHEFNVAKSPNEFEEIPVNKPRQSEQQKQAKTEAINKNGLSKSTIKRSAEAESYEAMFDTDSYSSGYAGDVVMGNSWNQRRDAATTQQPVQSNEVYIPDNINAKGLGNWEDQFRAKVSSQPQTQYQQPVQQHHYQQPNQPQYQSNFDVHTVERIINETVDRRMRDLISEVLKLQNKETSTKTNELTYKRVKGKNNQIIENVISIDGKLFRIEEIKPRN